MISNKEKSLKVGLLSFQKSWSTDEKYFLFHAISSICSKFYFDHVGKWLQKKAKVKFKIYDITDWTTNT